MSDGSDERIDEARRRLAKAGLWAVPAVLSVVYVRSAEAQQSPSCNPYTMGMMGMGMDMDNMGMGPNSP
jgi:hypothetical protein